MKGIAQHDVVREEAIGYLEVTQNFVVASREI